jgi:hypothetical protein
MAKTTRQSSVKPVTIHDQKLTRGDGGELLGEAPGTQPHLLTFLCIRVDPEADEGLIELEDPKAVAKFVESCRKLRLWGREMAVKL